MYKETLRQAWGEIDMGAFDHNVKEIKMIKKERIENYEIDYKHSCMLLSDLQAWFRFMLKDGNIQPDTYQMMDDTLSTLFENYKRMYEDVEGD